MLSAEEDATRGRRGILTGLAASLASMPLAAILADSVLARAAAQELERVTLRSGNGREVAAFLAVPVVELFHKW